MVECIVGDAIMLPSKIIFDNQKKTKSAITNFEINGKVENRLILDIDGVISNFIKQSSS